LRLTREEQERLDAVVGLFGIHRSRALRESIEMAHHMLEALRKIAQENPQEAVHLGTTVLNIVSGQEVADKDAMVFVLLVRTLLDIDPRGFRTRIGWFLASMGGPEEPQDREGPRS